ncbi:Rv3235 family protein [Actinophytocola sp.]|uniref:Rv3235 family protein n=1 Tax=Actinophytocola sp. TaxID=1872138 RepID=UPI002D7F5DAC|nr:Rv3235 family protein [Actinophytocola sp.]HET9138121.1 Rv3235 family protein [Actinophytocola sp.]
MSAPAVSRPPRVLLRTLPEYEPSRHAGPPGPDEPPEPPPVAAAPWQGPDRTEPGPTRPRLALLAGLILEAVDGRRPLGHVRDLVTPDVYAALCTRQRQQPGRHRLRSLHTCRPTPSTVEVCATVTITGGAHPTRYVAYVARFDETETGWLCTLFRPV